MSEIGRNDPCPCGSGKKYKKCCITDTSTGDQRDVLRKTKHNDDFLPRDAVPDYGHPVTNEGFLAGNSLHEYSAPKLIYSCLLYPGVDKLASRISQQYIFRGKGELRRIETAKDAESLIEIMRNNPDPLNHEPLIDGLMEQKLRCVPMILQELREIQNDSFVEIAVRALHRSGTNCSKEVISIIQSGKNRKAYAISVLCVLLGFLDNEYSEKLLWDYYHHLKFNYPNETYADGPLLGLIEIRERRKEQSPSNQLSLFNS